MIIQPLDDTQSLAPAVVAALRARLAGRLLEPGDEGYEAARRVQNLAIDRRPALIVRARGVMDVIAAVEVARAHALPLAVRSGGHSVPGHSAVDGGVVVDLSEMREVRVDSARRVAWVQPGATSADLCAATQPHGLALSTGDTASVGVGGLAIGGGIGWLARAHGLTIDSLRSATVVTADGRVVVASAEEHPDLFWAIRGGGGNFGVVTEFEFDLKPVGMVLGGALILPLTAEVLRGYAAYTPQAPEALTTITNVMLAPPLPFIPAEAHGTPVAIVMVCYAGDVEAGQRALEPVRALATPVAEMIGPMPYPAIYALTAEETVPMPFTVRSGFMEALPDAAIDLVLEHFARRPKPFGIVQLRGLGGAVARVPREATAFAHRDKPLLATIISMGGEEADRTWAEDLWRGLAPHASGVYVNFLADEGPGRVRDAYPAATYARLAEVKRRYDPENLFRLNQNVPPAD